MLTTIACRIIRLENSNAINAPFDIVIFNPFKYSVIKWGLGDVLCHPFNDLCI